jgi:hypothetical protein
MPLDRGSIGAARLDWGEQVPPVRRVVSFPVGSGIGHPAVDRGLTPLDDKVCRLPVEGPMYDQQGATPDPTVGA